MRTDVLRTSSRHHFASLLKTTVGKSIVAMVKDVWLRLTSNSGGAECSSRIVMLVILPEESLLYYGEIRHVKIFG